MNTILPYLLTLLQEYGYPILWLSVFIGALGIPLPNTLVLLAAGAFAAAGDFNFALLLLVSISAFVAGDNCSYWIGRRWGSKLLAHLEKSGRLLKPQTLARSRAYFHRLGGWAIFCSRFLVSALGGALNLLAGAEIYPYRRFLVFDIGGESLGALLPLSLGYIFGASWGLVGDILGSFSYFFVALMIALVLGFQAVRLLLRLRKNVRTRNMRAITQEAILEDPLTLPPAKPAPTRGLP